MDRPDEHHCFSMGENEMPVRLRSLAGRAAAEPPAFGEQVGAGRTMDRAIDTAAAEQRRICGVDDRVGGKARNIAALQADAVIRRQTGCHRERGFIFRPRRHGPGRHGVPTCSPS